MEDADDILFAQGISRKTATSADRRLRSKPTTTFLNPFLCT